MNTFLNELTDEFNYKATENGGLAHATTKSAVLDMFATGAAYRNRPESDVILLFKNAFEEDETLALKCLFWIRDCRGGAGERRFFRLCINWLAENYPDRVRDLVQYIPDYGRYDDLYQLFDTPLEGEMLNLIKTQLTTDMETKENGISLISKWMPSENASSPMTVEKAKRIRKALKLTAKQYRQMLSKLRKKVNVLERLMSANEWDKIEFEKIPSRAGIIYKNAFARRDIIARKYEAFAKDKNTKVNAKVLYPYEVVDKALNVSWSSINLNEVDRAMVNKYWENLPNYFGDKECSMMCVVDTSGSMCGYGAAAPINVAISLGVYCAERLRGPFANHYISFSRNPQLIKVEGTDFVEKVARIYRTNLCENTNLEKVFDLLLQTAKAPGVKATDIPETIVIISDMEIDEAQGRYDSYAKNDKTLTMMEDMRKKWERRGLKMPKLVYWNVDARHNTILDLGPDVSYVSGMSPTLFKQIITGKTGYQLMMETICASRYDNIK